MKRVACVIYYFGKKYERIGVCAVNSFRKFHPTVDLFHINESNAHEYFATKRLHKIGYGPYKYLLAAEIMIRYKYDKVIIMGADTITCAPLKEFLDGDEDILATLDYPYRLEFPAGNPLSPDSETHVNADVVCFNNSDAILDIVRISNQFGPYAEQGALNSILWSGNYNYSFAIVDAPYSESKVVYNARAKGNIAAAAGTKPWHQYTKKFFVEDGKLFTHDKKQIKVWHYCEGLGAISEQEFARLMNEWVSNWFNEETKLFFRKECDCGDFFEQGFFI